jgi:farnesol dehydrogenase
MKIFITGGLGSIGAYIIKILLNQGHEVHAIVRSLAKAKPLSHPKLHLFEGDLREEQLVLKAMEGCEQMYHLAAFAKVWSKNEEDFFNLNVKLTEDLFHAAHKSGIKKIVFTSTAGVFGPSITGIINEDKSRDLPFFNSYEATKSQAEDIVKDFISTHNMEIVIVSPTRVYGPILLGEVAAITMMIDKYVNKNWRIYPGTGKEIGNYIYVEDAAMGHVLAMEKGRSGECYILGGENLSYIEFFQAIAECSGIKRKMIVIPYFIQKLVAHLQLFMANCFGKEPDIVPNWLAKAKYHWEVSPKKAQQELGLPITPFEDGIKKTVDFLIVK